MKIQFTLKIERGKKPQMMFVEVSEAGAHERVVGFTVNDDDDYTEEDDKR